MIPEQKLASPRERTIGRPPVDKMKKRFWDNDLHDLLIANLGHVEGLVKDNRIQPAVLARLTGKCRFTGYRWLNENRISTAGAKKIIQLSEGKLTIGDLAPFLIA